MAVNCPFIALGAESSVEGGKGVYGTVRVVR